MKLLLRSVILVVSAIWIAPNAVFASHISGGDISYECLGNNQYKITLNLFRDCSGITMSNSESISLQSSCGTQNLTASLVNPGGTEISQLCAEQTPNSTCSGGNLPGMERYTYEVTATMTPCSDWVISWSTCCRNTTVNVPTSSSDGVYIEAGMNSALDSCNNSPVFTSQPIPYVCANTQVIYNWGITELDGDSLTYELFAARDDASTNLTYTSPYSASNPINGIVIDQFTGQITFTPTTIGNFIIAVLVNEYDSAGNLLSTTMRDIQFVVQNCSNNPPPAGQGEIDSLTGTANQTGAFALELCDGGSFTFNVTIADSNSQDTITLTSNVTTVLPGSVFTTTGINPVTATISWSAPGGSTFFNYFTLFANDGACPIAGIQSYVYQVSVIPGTVAGPDTSILCGAQAIQLGAIGGTNFVWSVISGDPIVVGTNFTCDSCPNPIARPSVTTFYEVVSDLTSSTCVNKDTVQVKVVPEFTYSRTQSDSSVCLQEQVQFVAIPDSTSTSYTYSWAPSGIFDNDTIADPIATFLASGTKTVYVEIISKEGCAKTDSMQVLVSSAIKPEVVVVADTSVCTGDSVQLNLVNNGSLPTCNYTLYMYDSFGDGWNGAKLTVSANGTLVGNYTINLGDSAIASIPVTDGSSLSISFTSGTFPNEESYVLYDAMGNILIQAGPSPQNGVVWAGTAECPGSGFSSHAFLWTPSIWLSDSSVMNPVAVPQADTVYSIVVTDTIGGCVDTTEVKLYLVPSFSYVKMQDDSSICLGDSVQFEVQPDSTSSSYSYNWTSAATFNDSLISNPAAVFNTPGVNIIYFEVTSLEGCSKNDTMQVLVSMGQTPITTIVADTFICAGDTVQFNTLNGCPIPTSCGLSSSTCPIITSQITVGTGNNTLSNVTYPAPYGNWYMGAKHQLLFTAAELNALGFQGGQISELAFNIASISGTTVYNNFEIKIGCTSLSSLSSWQTGLVTVFPAQTINITPGWNTHTFTNSYNWDGQSNIIIDICFNNQPLFYTNNSPTYYTPTTFNSVLYYNDDGNPTVCSSPLATNVSKNRPNVRFSVRGGLPTSTFNYSWSPSVWLSDSSILDPLAFPQSNTAYTLIVTDTIGGCADTASINIYVNTQFNFQKSQSNDSICLGESVQFTLTPDTGQVYTYQWIPALYLDNASISSPVAGPMNMPGNYTYIFTISNGCEKTDSMKITVSQGDLPVISIAGNDSICEGGNTQLTATSTGGNAPTYSFDWTNGLSLSDSAISNPLASPSATTTYTLIVTDTIGQCADTATFTVGVVPYPVAQIAPLTDSVCELDNFMVLTATPTGGSWSGTGTTVNGIFAPNLAGPGTHTVTYSVTLPPSGFGCTDQDILTINVYPNPEVPTASTSDPYCAFSTIDSMVATAGGGFITWYNDAALTDTFYYGNPVYNIEAGANSFDVWVTETSVMGCESNGAFNLTIEIISNPSASFTANPAQGFSPLTVDFTNTSQPDTNNFTWDFAGLGSSTLDDPSFVFNEPGTYEVTLTATDTNGCMDTSKVTIIVDEDSKLVIPNIFTPNGDGKNDVFKVQYTALTAFNVAIFTRWGTKVYESTDPSQGWDGKDKQGQEVHPGVYFYVITASDRKGNPITDDTIKGTVTLVRD